MPLSFAHTLYCIRHGETDWNKERRYQGQRDIPMNATGRAQARRNGRRLRELGITSENAKFVASPLARTHETMQLVQTELGCKRADVFATDVRLMEVHYGVWEGQLLSDLECHDADALAARRDNPYTWRPTGGESYADLMARVDSWLDGVKRDTVVVTHGGVSRVLRYRILDLDPSCVLQLEVPQDKVLRLSAAGMAWL